MLITLAMSLNRFILANFKKSLWKKIAKIDSKSWEIK